MRLLKYAENSLTRYLEIHVVEEFKAMLLEPFSRIKATICYSYN